MELQALRALRGGYGGRWLVGVALVASACGATSRRDLEAVPQRQITFDDLCGLQTHFDQRAAAGAPRYRALDEQSTETTQQERDENGQIHNALIGEGTYVVRLPSDRARLDLLLRTEYRRLPEFQMRNDEAEVRLHVAWWRSGTFRRLIPGHDIEVAVDGKHFELPFNPCVGEFLFGDDAYAMRRHYLEAERARANGEPSPPALPPAAPSPGNSSVEAPVVPDAATLTDAATGG